ncbi:efflux RND transporter periplasmic adaptor subunit [Rahnella rivi]|uniref:efflux RND transporter periplasmic adaptor subunit n=1 Tax=Rahnella TaxID=34037 RepID=UPI000700305D|nr:efflux RND transporter periplasmic adaptor subunit [Rahnella rivi]KQN63876.1 acriflavin resistance protein AcrA [Serratia sp. Leaf51]MBU9830419.1 efflux RND transporter periplasmic adaptor subunit [Rahnella rivi]
MTDTFTDYASRAICHLTGSQRLRALWPFLLLIPLGLALTACHDQKKKSEAPARPVRFIIAPAPSGASTLLQTGEIRAHDDVTLSFRQDGRLISRAVDVGDHVRAGQLLATQESDTSQNQLSSARADLNSARAAERVAALNLHRMTLLMPQGAISRAQFDTAQSDWQAALSRRQSSESSLKTAQDNLAWTRLTAPDDGVITAVSASAGQVVSSGQAVVTVAGSNARDAVFNVATPQALTQQSAVSVSLLSDPAVRTTGHLRDISPQADPQTRTWRVRVTLDNPPPAMALGASVQGAWQQSGQTMISLPASALTRIGNKPAVFVVDRASQRLQLREVTLGRYTTDDISVCAGIVAGDAVVTAGVSKLRQGEKVIAQESNP